MRFMHSVSLNDSAYTCAELYTHEPDTGDRPGTGVDNDTHGVKVEKTQPHRTHRVCPSSDSTNVKSVHPCCCGSLALRSFARRPWHVPHSRERSLDKQRSECRMVCCSLAEYRLDTVALTVGFLRRPRSGQLNWFDSQLAKGGAPKTLRK